MKNLKTLYQSKYAGLALLLIMTYGLLAVITGGQIFTRDAFAYAVADFWSYGFVAQHIITQGWFPLKTLEYGVPFGFYGADFPMADTFSILLMRVIAFFTHDWVLLLKIYYLLSFGLCASLAYAAFRQFEYKRWTAILAAVVFTFLPYHFLRTGQMFIASYHTVSLFLLSCAYIINELKWRGRLNGKLGFVLFIIMQIIIAGSGVYYAFFACFLYLILLSAVLIRIPSRRRTVGIGVAVLTIILISAAQTIPTIAQKHEIGKNTSIPVRYFSETEQYGLKISQLLLPTEIHRIKKLRDIEQGYSTLAPLVNENRTTALGILGSLGLLLSLAYMLTKLMRASTASSIPDSLQEGNMADSGIKRKNKKIFKNITNEQEFMLSFFSLINITCILYATVGGFGVLFSYFVFPEIRSVNRISVFIGLASIGFLFFIIQALLLHFSKMIIMILGIGLLTLITCLAAWEQTPILNFTQAAETLRNERVFFSKITNALPAGSSVFELPYHPYPEGGSRPGFDDYALLKGALFAPSLRWSMPTFRGREGDVWHRYVASLSPEHMVEQVKEFGFNGIYVDGNGYDDHGVAINAALQQLLGEPVVVDAPEGNRSLFAWKSDVPKRNSIAFLSTFREIKPIEAVASTDFKLNLDAFQDAPIGAVLRISRNERLLLEGWLGADGKSSRRHIQVILSSNDKNYEVDAYCGMQRLDVQSAIKTADPYVGFLTYAMIHNVVPGEYNIYLQYKDNNGTLIRRSTNRRLTVE